jgi:hypothetical protein
MVKTSTRLCHNTIGRSCVQRKCLTSSCCVVVVALVAVMARVCTSVSEISAKLKSKTASGIFGKQARLKQI